MYFEFHIYEKTVLSRTDAGVSWTARRERKLFASSLPKIHIQVYLYSEWNGGVSAAKERLPRSLAVALSLGLLFKKCVEFWPRFWPFSEQNEQCSAVPKVPIGTFQNRKWTLLEHKILCKRIARIMGFKRPWVRLSPLGPNSELSFQRGTAKFERTWRFYFFAFLRWK